MRGESLPLSLALCAIASWHVGSYIKIGFKDCNPHCLFLLFHPHCLCCYSSLLEVSLESGQLRRSELQNYRKRVIFNLDALSSVIYRAAPNTSVGAVEWGDQTAAGGQV